MTTPVPPAAHRPGFPAVVARYAAVRLGLLAIITALLLLAGVPLVISVLVGLIVALPLSMVLFRGLRIQFDAALAEMSERRSAERAALRARLRGDVDQPAERRSGDQPQDESEPGRG
ncbi:MAG: DUF4229 domain-containing protein [Pseudonocardia sp.]